MEAAQVGTNSAVLGPKRREPFRIPSASTDASVKGIVGRVKRK
jgi:hypothetical protein